MGEACEREVVEASTGQTGADTRLCEGHGASLLAGASGSTGQTGASGQTGLTGESRLWRSTEMSIDMADCQSFALRRTGI